LLAFRTSRGDHNLLTDVLDDVLDQLPPDQLVFLTVLVEIYRLEPDFAGFLEPAIADFANAWLDHCWSFR
jgi:hypothetical protein